MSYLLDPGWLGVAIGIVGILIAVVIARRSHIRGRPVYQISVLRLVGEEVQALPTTVEIRFNNVRVRRLNKTYFRFWNAGRDTIRGSDIVKHDAITIVFNEDCEILDIAIVKSNRLTNNVHLSRTDKPNMLQFTFDYLEAGDGILAEILHTSNEPIPVVKGSIVGVPNGLENWSIRDYPISRNSKIKKILEPSNYLRFQFVIMGVFGIVGVVASLATLIRIFVWSGPHEKLWPSLGLLAFSLLFLLIGSPGLWVLRRRAPRSLAVDT